MSDPAPQDLVISVDGYEGPLDLLLALARSQKVDLRHVSILQLAEQYLEFVEEARRLRLDLAADYLVTAAWLAYLKSRMLLPQDETEDGGPSGAALAEHLAFQLERLEAMRKVAAQLLARDQLGRDIFPRGMPEDTAPETVVEWDATLLDLLKAYARHRTRDSYEPLSVARRRIYTMEQALKRLSTLIGEAPDWRSLEQFLPKGWRDPAVSRSAVASTFAASLELAREGALTLRQNEAFGPIHLKPADSQESAPT